MPKAIKEIVVMIHPHFAPYIAVPDELHSPVPKSPRVSEFKPRKAGLTRNSASAYSMFQQSELIHRFYRREIQRVRKNPNVALFFLAGKHDLRPFTPEFESEGLTAKEAGKAYRFCNRYQDQLIKYAQKGLGKRLLLGSGEPTQVGAALKKLIAEKKLGVTDKTKVTVFGEYTSVCVDYVDISLLNEGFNSDINAQKSTGGELRFNQAWREMIKRCAKKE